MSIRRGPRPESRFYTLDKAISEDERLSWAARGMLIFLLGKPDHWEVSVKHLIGQTSSAVGKSSGRDGVRVILKELEQAGYLVADVARNEGGIFAGMAYTVYEQPVLSPVAAGSQPACEKPQAGQKTPETENPAPVLPGPVNPHLVSNDVKQDTETAVKKPMCGLVESIFDHWRVAMASPRAKLDTNRRGLIERALLKGYSPNDLKLAITGCAASPYHMGINERKTKYNGLDLILRNAEKIESFMVKAVHRPAGPAPSVTDTLSGKVYESTPSANFAPEIFGGDA